MINLQVDLLIFSSIIFLNIIISLLYRKYKTKQTVEEEKFNSGNHSVLVKSPSPAPSISFMPGIPFIILYRAENKSLRKILIVHNLLCGLVYVLFLTAIVLSYKQFQSQ